LCNTQIRILVYSNVRMNHTTVLFAIAAIAATLLAAGTVAALGSNHSAFAHKGYKNKYNNNQYAREDKSGRDGDNIIAAKQSVKCIVVGHDDGVKRSDGVKTTAEPVDETGHAIGPNSCNADQTINNGGPPPIIPPGQPCAGFVFDVHLTEASGSTFPKGTEICLFKPGENSPNASPPGATIIPPGGKPLTGQTVRIDHSVRGGCPQGVTADVDTGFPPDGFSLGDTACITISH
jgi:hypothetical protein